MCRAPTWWVGGWVGVGGWGGSGVEMFDLVGAGWVGGVVVVVVVVVVGGGMWAGG